LCCCKRIRRRVSISSKALNEVSGRDVASVDGFGTPGEKLDDYRIFDKQQLIQYPGFKLFYRLDKPLMFPSDVLNLDPPPPMVMYQQLSG